MNDKSVNSLIVGSMLLACASSEAMAVAENNATSGMSIVVEKGDTVYGLAKKYTTSPAHFKRILKLNHIRDPRRLAVGTVLHIPNRILAEDEVEANIASVRGEVKVGASPVAVGQNIKRGDRIETGSGRVTIKLVDGSEIMVRPASTFEIEKLTRYRNTALLVNRFRLGSGRAEVHVTPQKGGVFEIKLPGAVAGVRGTVFRVAAIENTASVSVVEGVVNLATAAAPEHKVGPGMAAVVRNGVWVGYRSLLPPIKQTLLPTDFTFGVSPSFGMPELPGASALQVALTHDDESKDDIEEKIVPYTQGAAIRFDPRPEGAYSVSIQGVDDAGIEGETLVHRFHVNATKN